MTKEEKLVILGRLLFWVGIAAALMGIGGIFFPWGETGFIVNAFRWKPFNPPYERMIMMIFFAMGICMILASWKPERHLLLVLFVILHGIFHGGVMLVDSLIQPEELTHLVGDVPMLLGIGVVFAYFMPWDDLKNSLS
jgi:uncharacterized membrane protein